MKPSRPIKALVALIIAIPPASLLAQLAIPSDGSDGALNITSNTVIDLSQAVTGVWSNDNSGNAGKGIYDPDKWAVVFKYSSVNIASGKTLSFKNHPTHAPVVWLVSGDVTINGTLSLDGSSYVGGVYGVAEPGPGGFRGGFVEVDAYGLYYPSAGFGVGGFYVDSGYYAGANGYGGYGSPRIVPLIGGSGGGGQGSGGVSGSGGGGAILVAASGNITINGSCSANGGQGANWGSGGAVRLLASQILGNGSITATSVRPGRIRLEANIVSTNLNIDPGTVAAAPTPVVIWPDSSAPTVRVVSVGGLTAPLDPKSPLFPPSEDITIVNTNSVAIVLQTSNFPTNGTVTVYLKSRMTYPQTLTAGYVSGDTSLATWQVITVLQPNYTVIQARAVSN